MLFFFTQEERETSGALFFYCFSLSVCLCSSVHLGCVFFEYCIHRLVQTNIPATGTTLEPMMKVSGSWVRQRCVRKWMISLVAATPVSG